MLDFSGANVDKKQVYIDFLLRPIKRIRDDELREKVVFLFKSAPEYFWRVASAITGKYHPPDEHVPSGLVKHTAKVVYFARGLAEAWDLEKYMDEITAAALLHDIIKYGLGDVVGSRKDYQMHDAISADWIIDTLKKNNMEVDEKVERVQMMVRTHLGKWSVHGDKIPPMSGELNVRLMWLLQTCDYVASQSKVIFYEVAE